MRRIDGMVVAITGASSGIGAALARELHHRGASLVVAARRRDRLLDLGLERCCVVEADVSDPMACHRIVDAAAPRIDVLVCNAGYGLARPIAETSEDEWLAILRTNLLGTVSCIRAAVPRMRAQDLRDGWRGQVMVVSSALARRSRPDGGAYAATKAAQLSLTEALRVELHDERIAVTSVHPVATDTGFVPSVKGGVWVTGRHEPRQSADHVARCMADAIARPCPEVWPHRASRWGLACAGFVPGLFDRYFLRRRRSEG